MFLIFNRVNLFYFRCFSRFYILKTFFCDISLSGFYVLYMLIYFSLHRNYLFQLFYTSFILTILITLSLIFKRLKCISHFITNNLFLSRIPWGYRRIKFVVITFIILISLAFFWRITLMWFISFLYAQMSNSFKHRCFVLYLSFENFH